MLHQLRSPYSARKKKKILGRGRGTGHGGSSTRGTKGQRARSGGGPKLGFEGGQTRLVLRIPKRGFTNPFGKSYAEVNLITLEQKFPAGSEVTPEILREMKIVKKNLPVKILGEGNLTKPLNVKVHAFSQSAQRKICACGGKIEVVGKIISTDPRT